MLAYDLYLNGDRSEWILMDRYRDSDAAMEHAANLGLDFADVRAVMHDAGPALIGLGRGARRGGGRTSRCRASCAERTPGNSALDVILIQPYGCMCADRPA
jgi:hypothetical protein